MSVIELSDGSVEVIRSAKDFSDMLDKKLGISARKWFDAFVEDYEQCSANDGFDPDSVLSYIT